jgi:NAD(P)-dependent dehydrogenase (short-subunit alcohol dehydrogenase family)
LITGAGRGIGQATARLFARAGATVILCARTKRQLDATSTSIKRDGGNAVARVVDIGSAGQVRALFALIRRRYGRLDILINNAGVLGPRVSLTAYPLPAWSRVIQINLTGTFHVTRQAARLMASRKHGCIVTVSSSVGRSGRAKWGAYAVSKFGVEGLSQVLADEYMAQGIIACTFNPGGTRTAMRAKAYPGEDRSHLRSPAEAAQGLLRLAQHATASMSGKAFDNSNLP